MIISSAPHRICDCSVTKDLKKRTCDSTGYNKEHREKYHSRQVDTLTRRVFSTPEYVWNVTAT